MNLTSPWEGDLMEPAFWGFVSFASKNLMDQYEHECGKIKIASGGIEKMIDQATGEDVREAQRFVDWCVEKFGSPEQVYGYEPSHTGGGRRTAKRVSLARRRRGQTPNAAPNAGVQQPAT